MVAAGYWQACDFNSGEEAWSTVSLVPVECGERVRQVYSWGGRNCEVHFAQVRGSCAPFLGVTLPTFMPETG